MPIPTNPKMQRLLAGRTTGERIIYRDHKSGGPDKRVWLESWPGDTFEILDAREFTALKETCESFGWTLAEAEDLD